MKPSVRRVTPSEPELPVSFASNKLGGAMVAAADVSIVKTSAVLSALALPATSMALAVI